MPTKSKVSDDEILDHLKANGRNVSRTAALLKVGKERVLILNRTIGTDVPTDPVHVKQQRTLLEDSESAVRHLNSVIRSLSITKLEYAHRLGDLYDKAVDKLLLIAGKPINIHQQQTTAPQTFDLSKISRAELMQLLALHDKLNGVPEPMQVSNLAEPVVYDDTEQEVKA